MFENRISQNLQDFNGSMSCIFTLHAHTPWLLILALILAKKLSLNYCRVWINLPTDLRQPNLSINQSRNQSIFRRAPKSRAESWPT